MLRRSVLGLVLVTAVSVMVGCAADLSSVSPVSTAVRDSSTVIPVSSFALEERLADGPVVLWFWAPGCGTCNSIASDVERAAKRHQGEVEFIGVSWYGNEASYRAFIERHGITFPTVGDSDGLLFTRFGVPGQPAFAFVAADGSATTVNGPLSAAEISARVAVLTG